MKKKDAYYFPHDSNAKDDPKCTELIESLGMEGYGIYWVLIETLRDQNDYKYPIKLLPAIARRYNTTADKVKAVVINYGLFKYDDEQFFFSESLIERMMVYDTKKEQARLAANTRWNVKKLECVSNASALQEQCVSNAIKENKIKENKIKEEYIKKENTKDNLKDISADADREFEEFWKIYNKSKDKPKTLKKWNTLKKDEKEKILIVVKDYVKSTPDKQYRKNPLTWLNGKCWDDEIVINDNKSENVNKDVFRRFLEKED